MSVFEEEEKIPKKPILIIVIVSIVVIAATLVFFLLSSFIAPPSTTMDFRLELNRTRLEVTQGKTVNVLITLIPEGSFKGDVVLETNKPGNMSIKLSRSILNTSSNTAILTIDVSNTAPGYYTVEISGHHLEATRKAILILSVKEVEKPFFKANASVYPATVMQMENFSINVSITTYRGFNDSISVNIENLPGCWVKESVIGGGINSSIITVYTSRNTPAGVNNFTLILSSPSHSVSIPLTIIVLETPPPDFQVSFYPNMTVVKPGDTVNILVNVKPLYGFNESIRIYSSYISVDLEKFNGSSFFLTTRNYSRAIISMKIDRRAKCGVYRLTFFANSSLGRREIGVFVGVTNVSYKFNDPIPGLAVLPSVVEATPGQEVYLKVLIGSVNGFQGEVIPSVSQLTVGTYYFSTGEGYPKIGLPISRVSISIGEAKFIYLRITVDRNAPKGIYRFKVVLYKELPFLTPLNNYTVELRIP